MKKNKLLGDCLNSKWRSINVMDLNAVILIYHSIFCSKTNFIDRKKMCYGKFHIYIFCKFTLDEPTGIVPEQHIISCNLCLDCTL